MVVPTLLLPATGYHFRAGCTIGEMEIFRRCFRKRRPDLNTFCHLLFSVEIIPYAARNAMPTTCNDQNFTAAAGGAENRVPPLATRAGLPEGGDRLFCSRYGWRLRHDGR